MIRQVVLGMALMGCFQSLVAQRDSIRNEYDYVSNFGTHGQSNWALVRKDQQYGFINRSLEPVVPAVYDKIYSFGSRNIQWALVVKDGLYGFIEEAEDMAFVDRIDGHIQVGVAGEHDAHRVG